MGGDNTRKTEDLTYSTVLDTHKQHYDQKPLIFIILYYMDREIDVKAKRSFYY